MKIRYTLSRLEVFKLILAALTGGSLSFRKASIACVEKLIPSLEVQGTENLPEKAGYVVLVNHYFRPGFRAWWISLAISSVIPREMHWIMAAAWTYPKTIYGRLMERTSRFLFRKIASVYDFTNMPPMPPRPNEVAERALAVRKVLRKVRDNPSIILGLAPEGGDNLDGKMHLPPSGAGRFIGHLQASGLILVPAGIYETDRLCLKFGPPLHLIQPGQLSADELDTCLSGQVYKAIAALLPENIILEELVQ